MLVFLSLKKISAPRRLTIGVLSDCAWVDFSPAGKSAVTDFTLIRVVATRK